MEKIKKACVETRLLALLSERHVQGDYIYALKDAAAGDADFAALLAAADGGEVRRVERLMGEAQADMLYDAADAMLAGLDLSTRMQHAMFLEYLESNFRRAGSRLPDCRELTDGSKA